jgi:competence protein ComEC
MPLLWLSLSFVCGILLGWSLGWSWTVWLALAGLALVLSMLSRIVRRQPFLHPSAPDSEQDARPWWASTLPYPILIASMCLGAARYQSTQHVLTPEQLAWHNDQDARLVIEGMVIAPPEVRDQYTLLTVQADQLRPLGSQAFAPVSGRLLARAPRDGNWHYGDHVRLQGWLTTPFENDEFSYRAYLAHQGIYSYFTCGYDRDVCVQVLESSQGNPLWAAIYALRQRVVETIYRLFPDPEASLMAGILLGVEGGIPEPVRQAFNDTGTSHIIAISGFNFAIIAGLFVGFFGWLLGRWRGMLAAFLGIALYAILAGASAGVVRAAIMGGLGVFAAQIGRRQFGLNSLALVAALMALADPHVLWDVGFQLSFMATLGLILYAEPLSQWFTGLAARGLPLPTVQRLAGPVGEYFLFTLAAQLTTLVLILYYFHRLSLVSFLANPLVLPAQPAVMILGGLAALAGVFFQPLGQIIAYLAWPFIAYTIRLVEIFARLPGAAWTVQPFSPWVVLAFYALLFGWTAFSPRLRGWISSRLGETGPRLAWIALAGLALATVVVWRVALAAPDGRLHLTMLDVGGGDALLIQTPSGRNLLVNGGASPNLLSNALGRRLPLGARQLDYLIVAAASEEQLAALPPLVERFPLGQVLWSGPVAGEYSARRLRQALTDLRIPIVDAQAGQILDLGRGASLHVLTVQPRGAVLLLEWGNFRALLPVGLDFDSMEALVKDQNLTTMTALLLADGGYAPLNPPEWIERWGPQVFLLSVAAGDAQGRPDPQVLEALQARTLLRTDRNGWIELSTDGEKLWVEVERR